MSDNRYDCGMGAWTSPRTLERHFNDLHKRVEALEEDVPGAVDGGLVEEVASFQYERGIGRPWTLTTPTEEIKDTYRAAAPIAILKVVDWLEAHGLLEAAKRLRAEVEK